MVFYVKFSLDTPYFGTDGEGFYKYEAEILEELRKMIEIDYEIAVRQHAEQYEYNVYGQDDDPSEEELKQYYDDCFACSSWELFTNKEEFKKHL